MQSSNLTRRDHNQIEVQWYEYLQDYFSLSLDDEAKVRWWREIRQEVMDANNLLLCNAIKWASDQSNGLRPEYKATLTDLIKWVKLFTAKHKESIRPVCDICNSTGWCDYYHGWKTDWNIEQYMSACVTKVPCLCVNKDAQTANMALTMREAYKAELRKA